MVTARGCPSTVISTRAAEVGLPKVSYAEIATRAVSPLPTTSLCVLGAITSWAAAPTRIATAVSARLGGVPAAIAVSATAPLPSRRGASNRKRAWPSGPGPSGWSRPADALSARRVGLQGAPSGSTAMRTISAKAPTSSVFGTSTGTRGYGAC